MATIGTFILPSIAGLSGLTDEVAGAAKDPQAATPEAPAGSSGPIRRPEPTAASRKSNRTGGGEVSPGAPASGRPTRKGPIDLRLSQSLVRTTTQLDGSTEVVFKLAVANAGSTPVAAGYTVTEVVPAGVTIVEMAPAAWATFVCTAISCTAANPLPPGAAAELFVTGWTARPGTYRNVAYATPASGETETDAIGSPPPAGADTAQTPTNNDAQAEFTAVLPSATPTSLPSDEVPGVGKPADDATAKPGGPPTAPAQMSPPDPPAGQNAAAAGRQHAPLLHDDTRNP